MRVGKVVTINIRQLLQISKNSSNSIINCCKVFESVERNIAMENEIRDKRGDHSENWEE